MTSTKKNQPAPRGRGRFSPTARAHLASIVVAGDRRRGQSTPQWIRDLAESRSTTR